MNNNANRFPVTLFALGLLGVSLYPRLSAGFPPYLRTDFAVGIGMGAFLGLEILGFLMLWKRKHTPQH